MSKYFFPRGTPFHERINILGPESCWEWQGARTKDGYGVYIPTKGNPHYAHRCAYERIHGPIPDGLLVCHKCDNPPCCNPDHLFLGTNKDNIDDRHRKGRTRTGVLRGAANPRAKFTIGEVRVIRARLANGESRKAIAKELDVHPESIARIARRKSYKEVI
jgi:hypothetical protein